MVLLQGDNQRRTSATHQHNGQNAGQNQRCWPLRQAPKRYGQVIEKAKQMDTYRHQKSEGLNL